MASSFIVKDIKTLTSSNRNAIKFNYGGVAAEIAKNNGKSLYFNVNNVIADMDKGASSTKAKNIGGVVGCSNENSMIDSDVVIEKNIIGEVKDESVLSNEETEKNFDMFFNDSILGYPFPLSHFEIAVLETNNCSASCS